MIAMIRVWCLVLAVMMLPAIPIISPIITPAFAVQPDEILPDPAMESRARHLSRELRCMVCQNQSIDDSDAPLARDLRLLVRERLKNGDSDTQVMDYMTARYGDFVLLNPRLTWRTSLLWGLPAVLLLGGVATLAVMIRRRRSQTVPNSLAATPLTAQEKARLANLIDGRDPGRS